MWGLPYGMQMCGRDYNYFTKVDVTVQRVYEIFGTTYI